MRRFRLLFALMIALSLGACGKGAAPTAMPDTPALPALPVSPAGGELEILHVSLFADSWGRFHLVGELQNQTAVTLTSIRLTIEVRDAEGNSLLRNESGGAVEDLSLAPLLESLAPGEATPFVYSFSPAGNPPASYQAAVAAYAAGQVQRADLGTGKVELVNDGRGSLYLSGELVNRGGRWARVVALAGAGLDADGQVATAASTVVYLTMLAPAGDALGRDRTPFLVELPAPPAAGLAPRLYVDAVVAEAPPEYGLTATVTNRYFDSSDGFHLVGVVSNPSAAWLQTLVVGGLYAEDGVALDAAWSFLPIALAPGASAPFDLASFGSVDGNAKQASRIVRATVQTDPWYTSPAPHEMVFLTAFGSEILQQGAEWTFRGSFTNDSGRDLIGATVVIAVYDGQRTLAATASAYLVPAGDRIAPGQTVPYEVTILLDPRADTAGYAYQVIVQGEVK